MGDPELVYAATAWPTNAAMIRDVAKLGYLHRDDVVLDPTYGRGGWWRCWSPYMIDAGDLYEPLIYAPPGCEVFCTHPGLDFRTMSHVLPHDCFEAVAFDPPYVCPGGRGTSYQENYGMGTTAKRPEDVQSDIQDGLDECLRVVKPGGIVLVKCQDYVTSGKLFPGTLLTCNHAIMKGFELVDRLEHISGPRPQPGGRRQVHARRNLSTLFVLRRPKR